MKVTCPHCGTFEAPAGHLPGHVAFTKAGEAICPACRMTAGEHAYRSRILADSDAVFRQECRAFVAKRTAERVA